MATIGIIGAGISGLSSAYYLAKATSRSTLGKIIIYESSARVGGLIETKRYKDDCAVFERGPRSIRSVGPAGHSMLRLVEDIGLSDELIAVSNSNPIAKNRYMYVNRELCMLPSGILSLFKHQVFIDISSNNIYGAPFSKSLAALGIKELFRKSVPVEDESVDSFFRRRFGDEIAKYAIDCLMRGIYSGKSTEISIKSVFPKLLEIEQKHGSVIKGSLIPEKSVKLSIADSKLLQRFKKEKLAMWSFEDGLQRLPERLEELLRKDDRVEFRTECNIKALRFLHVDGGISASVEYSLDGQCTADHLDHVIAALPARKLAAILDDKTLTPHQLAMNDLSRILRVNNTATVGVVSFHYDRGDIIKKPAFGHLIPSCEPSNVLGVLYESCVFPRHNGTRNHGNSTRISCMMGGAWYREQFGDLGVSEGELADLAKQSLAEQMGITDTPFRQLVKISRDCIPQYSVGHTSRVEEMRDCISVKRAPLTLLGASYDGVSVNDCVARAHQAVDALEIPAPRRTNFDF